MTGEDRFVEEEGRRSPLTTAGRGFVSIGNFWVARRLWYNL